MANKLGHKFKHSQEILADKYTYFVLFYFLTKLVKETAYKWTLFNSYQSKVTLYNSTDMLKLAKPFLCFVPPCFKIEMLKQSQSPLFTVAELGK